MTVKQLKKHLRGLPDELPIILQKDSEGNGYSPLAGVDEALYKADSTWDGQAYHLTDEDKPEDAIACIVLFPTN